jgi:hypothetical protein
MDLNCTVNHVWVCGQQNTLSLQYSIIIFILVDVSQNLFASSGSGLNLIQKDTTLQSKPRSFIKDNIVVKNKIERERRFSQSKTE